jgi:hypothetical protein
MVVYRNTSVVVHLEQETGIIRHTWSGYPSSEEYRNTFRRSLKVAKKHRVNKWLIDQRALKKFQYEDLKWGIEQWVPQAVSLLGTGAHIAIVLSPTNQFGKLGADISMNAVRAIDASCRSQYFTNFYEARSWIATISRYQLS